MEKFKAYNTGILEGGTIEYIKNYLETHDNVTVYVGTDSVNNKTRTVFASVILMYRKGKGGHYIYDVKFMPKIRDMHLRLSKEIEYSRTIAKELQDAGLTVAIDLDINPSDNHASHALKYWIGSLIYEGFDVRIKPVSWAASRAADFVLGKYKKRKEKKK